MSDHPPTEPGPTADLESLADRLAIQDLIAAYALAVDRRDYSRLGEIFIEDGILATHSGGVRRGGGVSEEGDASEPPRYEMVGRARILRGMQTVERYQATTHLLGVPNITLSDGSADCETSCLAHHLYEKDGEPRIYVMSIRYRDRCVRDGEGRWRFAERRLQVDWEEDRVFHPSTALGRAADS